MTLKELKEDLKKHLSLMRMKKDKVTSFDRMKRNQLIKAIDRKENG